MLALLLFTIIIVFVNSQLTFDVSSCEECSVNGTFCFKMGAADLVGECYNDTQPLVCKCFYATNPYPCSSYSFSTCNLFTNFCKLKKTKRGRLVCIDNNKPSTPTKKPTKRRRRRHRRRRPSKKKRRNVQLVFPFSIELKYEITPSAEIVSYFEAAKQKWMEIITTEKFGKRMSLNKYECGCNGIKWTCSRRSLSFTGLLIYVKITDIDGVGSRAGQTAICRTLNNFVRIAMIQLDRADLIALQNVRMIMDVILHEMGHAVGLGGTWGRFNLVDEDGEYMGQFGNSGHKMLGLSGNALVEQKGGAGSIRSHWRESVYGSELMTPILMFYERHPISILTIQALRDLGHDVNKSYVLEKYTPIKSPMEMKSSDGGWETNELIILT